MLSAFLTGILKSVCVNQGSENTEAIEKGNFPKYSTTE